MTLRALMDERNLTTDALAEAAGISPRTTRRVIAGTGSEDARAAVANAIGLPVEIVFPPIGIGSVVRRLEPQGNTLDVIHIIGVSGSGSWVVEPAEEFGPPVDIGERALAQEYGALPELPPSPADGGWERFSNRFQAATRAARLNPPAPLPSPEEHFAQIAAEGE